MSVRTSTHVPSLQMNIASQLIGAWGGATIGSVSISATFYSNNAVEFVGEIGSYDLQFPPQLNPVLQMSFSRERTGSPFVTTNNVLLLNDTNLILATDRGPLALTRMQDTEYFIDLEPKQTPTDPNQLKQLININFKLTTL
jgi:hypothetical protein